MLDPTCLSEHFPGHVVSYFYLDLNEKRRQEKKGGGSDYWLDVRKRGGGSFRWVLCATGGEGGSNNQEKMRM